MKKVAKAERKVSGAGDITVKKTPKVVAPEPREPHTKRLPVSTPSKGSKEDQKLFGGGTILGNRRGEGQEEPGQAPARLHCCQ